ncbi:MAG: hypothetical protein D6759_01185 [Chloroflexi bacterium]|nr:MAG: hypothetical protein D6759_01185 [Chloroflexota bacterium]
MDKRYVGVLLMVMLIALLVVGSVAHAQGSSGYDLSWWTADGGGGTLSNGSYALSGTIGQPDAGTTLTNGNYTLVGGFWGAGAAGYQVYLPVVLRNR